MAEKVLKSNGRIVVRSTFRSLTETELNSSEGRNERSAFYISVKEKLGNEANYEDYKDDPDYDTTFFDL